jgi:hypothetical protein
MIRPSLLYVTFPILIGSLLLSGCGKNEPEYVEVMEPEPRETPAEPGEDVSEMAAMPDDDVHRHAHQGPGFTYSVPDGWQLQEPSSMKLLSLLAGSPPEELAELSVSAFPGDVGGQLANINRWRRQVGLGPLSPEAADEFVTSIQISGMDGWQVDFTGPEGTSERGGATRVRVAVLVHEDKSWFFKLMGEESSVADELEGYEAFLRSVQF